MSTLPCFKAEIDGVHLYFSHVFDIVSLRLLDLSVSWRFIARSLEKLALTDETGLNEISRLGSGECEEIDSGKSRRQIYWDPLSIAHSGKMACVQQATTALRNVTRACVRAWATCHDAILLELSGGLDSSIVLGCLSGLSSNTAVTGVVRYSSDAISDERPFARLAANNSGIALLELPRNPSFDVSEILKASPTERPQSYLVDVGQGNAVVTLARSLGCTAIFSGTGGDELFFNGEPCLSVADYIHDCGIGKALLDTTLTVSRLQGLSVWKVLRQSVVKGIGTHKWDPKIRVQQFDPLVNWDAVNTLVDRDACPAPWFSVAHYVPPGKQFQISSVIRHGNEAFVSAFGRSGDPERANPLLSQPLVELVLKLPTYWSISGGWDRAIARRAFVPDVPREILRRRWKGMQENYTAEIFSRNLGFMRELLLDGRLIAEGLLHRQKIESALSGGPSGVMQGMRGISKHLAVEVWLRICAQYGTHITRTNPKLSINHSLQFSEA